MNVVAHQLCPKVVHIFSRLHLEVVHVKMVQLVVFISNKGDIVIIVKVDLFDRDVQSLLHVWLILVNVLDKDARVPV